MATKATTRQSTTLLKKYLNEKYNTNANIKSEFYSGGSSLNVKYNLGLNTNFIKSDLSRLQGGTFNGMIDLYEYKNNAETGIVLNGFEIQEYKFVFVDRIISDEFKLKIAQAFFTTFNFSNIEKPETIEDYFRSDQKIMNAFGTWSIADYMYRHICKMNFVTNNESEIENLWFEDTDNIDSFDGQEMFYQIAGQTYSTKKVEIIKKTEKVVREKTILLNDIRLIDYSEKAIAVIGNTYEIKDELKEIGGRFNKFLKVEGEKVAGWVFSKSKENEVSNLLIEYSKK